jgi:myosin-crossreactive antigen
MEIKVEDRLLRIGQATTGYYKQLNSKELTEEDFKLWIDSLEEPMKGAFNKKGLKECRGVLNFQRFILELQDIGLDEYLKNNLTEEDFSYWIANK